MWPPTGYTQGRAGARLFTQGRHAAAQPLPVLLGCCGGARGSPRSPLPVKRSGPARLWSSLRCDFARSPTCQRRTFILTKQLEQPRKRPESFPHWGCCMKGELDRQHDKKPCGPPNRSRGAGLRGGCETSRRPPCYNEMVLPAGTLGVKKVRRQVRRTQCDLRPVIAPQSIRG